MPIGPFGGSSARIGVHDLKPVLHRYLIDALEDKGENLLSHAVAATESADD